MAEAMQRARNFVMPWVDHGVFTGAIREHEWSLHRQAIEDGEVMIV